MIDSLCLTPAVSFGFDFAKGKSNRFILKSKRKWKTFGSGTTLILISKFDLDHRICSRVIGASNHSNMRKHGVSLFLNPSKNDKVTVRTGCKIWPEIAIFPFELGIRIMVATYNHNVKTHFVSLFQYPNLGDTFLTRYSGWKLGQMRILICLPSRVKQSSIVAVTIPLTKIFLYWSTLRAQYGEIFSVLEKTIVKESLLLQV